MCLSAFRKSKLVSCLQYLLQHRAPGQLERFLDITFFEREWLCHDIWNEFPNQFFGVHVACKDALLQKFAILRDTGAEEGRVEWHVDAFERYGGHTAA